MKDNLKVLFTARKKKMSYLFYNTPEVIFIFIFQVWINSQTCTNSVRKIYFTCIFQIIP